MRMMEKKIAADTEVGPPKITQHLRMLFALVGVCLTMAGGVTAATNEVIRLEGKYSGHLQDVCMDAETIWWMHTAWLVKTDRSGRVLAKVNAGGHHAGCEIRNGHLFSAVCAYNGEPRGSTSVSNHVMVGEYDAKTLSLVKMHVMDIHDRAGSLCFLEDGSMLVGCLRHPSLKPNEVKFHHFDRNYRLLGTHVIDVGQPVKLGIEVIRRYGSEIFLFIYGAPVVKLSADDFRVIGRYRSYGGQFGFAREGDWAWVGNVKGGPRLVRKPYSWKEL